MCLFQSEEFDFLAEDVAKEVVGQARCAEAEIFVVEPFFAEHFLDDGVIFHCVFGGGDAAGALKPIIMPVFS